MEHEQRSRNLGTIYFPIALLVNVLLTWAGSIPIWIGGLGIMIMGYGDGLASLVGERFGRRPIIIFGNRKSVAGTVTMFLASAAVSAVFILVFADAPSQGITAPTVAVAALTTAAAATLIELLTPFGLDNLTVPIITALLFAATWG
jgi:phytol kinase